MAKHKGDGKPPSRQRYDDEHRVRSFRLDKESNECLDKHLEDAGCSLTGWVLDNLRGERSMVEKRIESLASKKATPAVEDRIKCLEDLLHQLLTIAVDTDEYPLLCPRCENELCRCDGVEVESNRAHPAVPTWACAKCGFCIGTYKGIDPKSIRWANPDTGGYASKPTLSARHYRYLGNKRK